MEKFKAIKIFHTMGKSIQHTLKAADIYALHVLAKYRNKKVNEKQIDEILSSNKVSQLMILRNSYTNDELNLLQKEMRLTNIVYFTIVSIYSNFEIYLENKYKEYFLYLNKNSNTVSTEKKLPHYFPKSLKDYKKIYKNELCIYLAEFELDNIFMHNNQIPWFTPKKLSKDMTEAIKKGKNIHYQTWEAIHNISDERNNIVHQGKPLNSDIQILPDAWSTFYFLRRWVTLFDAGFDSLIYNKPHKGRLIKNYLNRVSKKNKISSKIN